MTDQMLRTCTGCGEPKPLSDYYFEKGRPRGKCKECHKAVAYRKRLEDPEAYRARERERYPKYREKAVAYMREYWDQNRDELNAKRRAVRAADPEYHRALQREYRANSNGRVAEVQRARYWREREKINAQVRERRAREPERFRQWEREYREKNRERVNEVARAYYAAHPEMWEKGRRAREARLRAAPYDGWTREEIYDRDGGVCRACDTPLTVDDFTVDHIVPIALDGPDIRANVELMCFTCNRRKWAKLEGQIHLPV